MYAFFVQSSERIEQIVVPVSYTHLDVYKRQERCGTSKEALERPGLVGHRKKPFSI